MGFPETISVASAILLMAGGQADTKTYTLKDALQICARVQDSGNRLACFEGLAKSSAAEPDGEVALDTDKGVARGPMTASELRAATQERRQRVEEGSDRTRGTYDAVVLRAWEYPTGDYYVALTNGEIWKSEARDKVRHVKDAEKVELQPGAIGGWFMHFKTLKRPAIRVRLVE